MPRALECPNGCNTFWRWHTSQVRQIELFDDGTWKFTEPHEGPGNREFSCNRCNFVITDYNGPKGLIADLTAE